MKLRNYSTIDRERLFNLINSLDVTGIHALMDLAQTESADIPFNPVTVFAICQPSQNDFIAEGNALFLALRINASNFCLGERRFLLPYDERAERAVDIFKLLANSNACFQIFYLVQDPQYEGFRGYLNYKIRRIAGIFLPGLTSQEQIDLFGLIGLKVLHTDPENVCRVKKYTRCVESIASAKSLFLSSTHLVGEDSALLDKLSIELDTLFGSSSCVIREVMLYHVLAMARGAGAQVNVGKQCGDEYIPLSRALNINPATHGALIHELTHALFDLLWDSSTSPLPLRETARDSLCNRIQISTNCIATMPESLRMQYLDWYLAVKPLAEHIIKLMGFGFSSSNIGASAEEVTAFLAEKTPLPLFFHFEFPDGLQNTEFCLAESAIASDMSPEPILEQFYSNITALMPPNTKPIEKFSAVVDHIVGSNHWRYEDLVFAQRMAYIWVRGIDVFLIESPAVIVQLTSLGYFAAGSGREHLAGGFERYWSKYVHPHVEELRHEHVSACTHGGSADGIVCIRELIQCAKTEADDAVGIGHGCEPMPAVNEEVTCAGSESDV